MTPEQLVVKGAEPLTRLELSSLVSQGRYGLINKENFPDLPAEYIEGNRIQAVINHLGIEFDRARRCGTQVKTLNRMGILLEELLPEEDKRSEHPLHNVLGGLRSQQKVISTAEKLEAGPEVLARTELPTTQVRTESFYYRQAAESLQIAIDEDINNLQRLPKPPLGFAQSDEQALYYRLIQSKKTKERAYKALLECSLDAEKLERESSTSATLPQR
jgi:hypothetical protein